MSGRFVAGLITAVVVAAVPVVVVTAVVAGRPDRPAEAAALAGHTDAVAGVALSADGRTPATAGWDDTAMMWNVPG